MGLRDILRAVREYPAARTELETVRSELRQAQQALEQSQQSCESLWLASNEQQEYTNFLSHKAEALRDALGLEARDVQHGPHQPPNPGPSPQIRLLLLPKGTMMPPSQFCMWAMISREIFMPIFAI